MIDIIDNGPQGPDEDCWGDEDDDRCETCGGDGWGIVGTDWDCDDGINGPYDGEVAKCPGCHGSGKATFQCDSCGREFSVAIDPAYLPPATWTLMEIAVDAVKQGVRYEGPRTQPFHFPQSSVTPDGDQLCDVCSSKEPNQ